MGLFNVVFHHDGEFVKEDTMFYRGGMETVITGQDSAHGRILKL